MCGVYPGVSLEARQKPITLPSLSLPSHSMSDNDLGPAGVQPIAEMLKVNKSIVNIK